MQPESQLHTHRALILLAAMATLLVQPLLLQAQGVGMSPMRVELKLAPGGQQSGSLVLNNGADTEQRVRAELLDFHLDAQATPQFEKEIPEEAKYTCRGWLSLNPMEAVLAAKGTVMARYTLRVPAGTKPGSYACAIGYTGLPTPGTADRMTVRNVIRVVCTIYVMVGNPPVEGNVKAIRLERVDQPNGQVQWRAVVVIENKAAGHFRASGKLDLLDDQGKVIESHELPSSPVLPEREQRFPFLLKTNVAHGKFVLRAQMDLGTKEIQEVTAVVESPQGNP